MRIARPDVTTPAFSPLYQQIKELILQSLQGGEWKPGEAIPSEMELAARFRVSQGTVRKAIDELAADNLVIRRQLPSQRQGTISTMVWTSMLMAAIFPIYCLQL